MNAIVVSDVHLGSNHLRAEAFLRFLDELPDRAALILNGDTVDHRRVALPELHQRALDRLREESRRRRVVWVRGNHDARYELADPAAIEFAPGFHIGRRLFVAHGWGFDSVLPYNKPFVVGFKLMHALRILLGAESVHVAFYAKRFPLLYGVLRRHVARRAVAFAKANGYAAVACGHTHHVEDLLLDGVRYLNTGAWTEEPVYYLWVSKEEMTLLEVPGA